MVCLWNFCNKDWKSYEYTVTEIWGLGNYTYFGKLSKLGKKTLLTFNDKMTQNIHRLFYEAM